MPGKLEHRQIHSAMSALGQAKILNLEASIQSLMDPLAGVLAQGGGEVSLHILCCNEYFLVTGLQASRVADVDRVADAVRNALSEAQSRVG